MLQDVLTSTNLFFASNWQLMSLVTEEEGRTTQLNHVHCRWGSIPGTDTWNGLQLPGQTGVLSLDTLVSAIVKPKKCQRLCSKRDLWYVVIGCISVVANKSLNFVGRSDICKQLWSRLLVEWKPYHLTNGEVAKAKTIVVNIRQIQI